MTRVSPREYELHDEEITVSHRLSVPEPMALRRRYGRVSHRRMFEQHRSNLSLPPIKSGGDPLKIVSPQSPLYSAVLDSALQHHNTLARRGAVLHERFDSLPWVRPSLSENIPHVILTGRWPARGVFTAALPVAGSEVLTGTLDMQLVLSLNPRLTPAGTFQASPWFEHPHALHEYILPRNSTLKDAIRLIGNDTAAKLLEAFPHRIDLAPTNSPASEDRATIVATTIGSAVLATCEVEHALKYAERLLAPVHIPIARTLEECSGRIVHGAVREALQAFRDIRLQTALYQYDMYGTEGPIAELVETVSTTATQRGEQLISKALWASPFTTPNPHTLKDILREALREAIGERQESRELWKLLSKQERRSLMRTCAARAWQGGARRYALSN